MTVQGRVEKVRTLAGEVYNASAKYDQYDGQVHEHYVVADPHQHLHLHPLTLISVKFRSRLFLSTPLAIRNLIIDSTRPKVSSRTLALSTGMTLSQNATT